MRRIIVASLLLALLDAVGLFAGTSAASAALEFNEQVSVRGVQIDNCAGDTVTLKGREHLLLTFTINRTHVSGSGHVQLNGVVGADSSGDIYHAVGGSRESFGGSLVNGTYHGTLVTNSYLIGKARAPSLKLHENARFVVTARGSVFFDHFRFTCQ